MTGRRWKVLTGIALVAVGPLAHPSALLIAVPLLLIPWVSYWLNRPPICDSWNEGLQHLGKRLTEDRVPWTLLSICTFVGTAAGLGWVFEVWSTYQEAKGGGSPFHLVLTAGYYVTPTLSLAFVYGAWTAYRSREHPAFIPLLASLPAFALAFLASFFVRVSAQYVFVVLPWVAAVAMAPLLPVGVRSARWSLVYLAFITAPGLLESGVYFLRNGDRPPWREAYAYVFEQHRDGDLLFGMDAPIGEYYFHPHKTHLRDLETITWLDHWRMRQVTDWMRYNRRTWYILNRELLEDWSRQDREEMLRHLEEDCELKWSFEVPLTPRDLDVEVYLRE